MTRAIRFELNGKNLSLLIGGGAVFAGLIALVTYFGHPGHATEEKHLGDPSGLNSAHGEGEHEDESEGEHAEGIVKLSPAALKNAGIAVAAAGPSDVNVTLSLPGEVTLNQDTLAHVTPRVSGTALEVKRQSGEVVKKGDVLAILQSGDLADVQRDFLASKERLSLAEATFARAELLQKDRVSSEKDFLDAKQALAEAKIQHRSAAQKLAAIGGSPSGSGQYALVAPFDGTIIERHISVGEVLSNESRAFTIANLSTIWVNVTVYAMDLPKVAVGQAAEVRAEGIETPAVGTIAYLGQVLGEGTRSATARVVLTDAGPAWRPGLFVTADIVVDRAKASVVVLSDAVQTVEGKDVVFVEENGNFEARKVKLGRKGNAGGLDGQVIEVVDGLSAGDRYVSKNSFILKSELGKSEAGHEH